VETTEIKKAIGSLSASCSYLFARSADFVRSR
jgi:hypothetical protein